MCDADTGCLAIDYRSLSTRTVGCRATGGYSSDGAGDERVRRHQTHEAAVRPVAEGRAPGGVCSQE